MSPPFYVVSSGDESTDGNTTDTSLSGSSHDTSRARYHIDDVESFATALNDAAKSAFPNQGRSRYETVNACLIRWEEDELLVDRELGRLSNLFQDYGFTTKKWQILTKNSHLNLMIKAAEFIRDADSDKNLFIVYYGGHGRINSERQAEWTCRRDPDYARVHWSAIQTLFAEAQSDVLILLDACAAASATARSPHGSMEAIMACGFESIAPPPGEHSFTNTLIDVLEDWIDRRSFSASCLHAEILSQLKLKENKKGREGKKLEWRVTPIHINCTQDSKAPSIELCRRNVVPPPSASTPDRELSTLVDAMDLDFDDPRSSPLSSIPSLAPSGRFPHVIISVALEESQPELDIKKTARWLENIPFLAKWAKVEGVFQSYSTILVLSVPIPVWNMLPDHPACSFIGYVTSPNLAPALPPSVKMESVGVPADDQDMEARSGDEKQDRLDTAPLHNLFKSMSELSSPFSVSEKPTTVLPPPMDSLRSSSSSLQKSSGVGFYERTLPSTLAVSPIDLLRVRLLDSDHKPMKPLGIFLIDVANHINNEFGPRQSFCTTPSKMASYYAAYDFEKEFYPFYIVFRKGSNELISRFYQDLGCEHYLILENNQLELVVLSLTLIGFVHWMITFMLAYPDEELARLEKVIQAMGINAVDGDLVGKKPEHVSVGLLRHFLPERGDPTARKHVETAIHNFSENISSSSKNKGASDSGIRRQASAPSH